MLVHGSACAVPKATFGEAAHALLAVSRQQPGCGCDPAEGFAQPAPTAAQVVVAGPYILSSITQSPLTFAFPMLHSGQCESKSSPKQGQLRKVRHEASLPSPPGNVPCRAVIPPASKERTGQGSLGAPHVLEAPIPCSPAPRLGLMGRNHRHSPAPHETGSISWDYEQHLKENIYRIYIHIPSSLLSGGSPCRPPACSPSPPYPRPCHNARLCVRTMFALHRGWGDWK